VFKQPPFRIQEEGWGEFDMSIELTADKSYTIQHDLNFAQTRYESKHVLVSQLRNKKANHRKMDRLC
jgi:transcription initiation factor IIF auxiliary subunit